MFSQNVVSHTDYMVLYTQDGNIHNYHYENFKLHKLIAACVLQLVLCFSTPCYGQLISVY
jgi:hypothetical protein